MKKTHLYMITGGAVLLAFLFGWLFFLGYLETEKPQIELAEEIYLLLEKIKKRKLYFPIKKAALPI